MPQPSTETVLWDEKKSAMGMESPLTPVPMTVDGLQASIAPFSLGSLESSPSPAQRNEKQGEREKEGKGDSSSVGSIVVGPSGSNTTTTTTNTHLSELAELAAALARALSYTEGYDLGRGKQTQQGMNDVYELQTLTCYPSAPAARHHHQSVGVEDNYCSPRPISRKVRAERRTRQYALV